MLGSTNRYTDGSGRKLDGMDLPVESNLQPISNRAYPVKGEHWQPMVIDAPTPHKGIVIIAGGGVVGLVTGIAFALRGWHTTIFEKTAALPKMSKESTNDNNYSSSSSKPGNCTSNCKNGNSSNKRGYVDITATEDDDDEEAISDYYNNNNNSNHKENCCLNTTMQINEITRENSCFIEKEYKEMSEMAHKKSHYKVNYLRNKLQHPHYPLNKISKNATYVYEERLHKAQSENANNNNSNSNSSSSTSNSSSSNHCFYDSSDTVNAESKYKKEHTEIHAVWPVFMELQYALLTRRGMDALEAIGVRLDKIRSIGVKVRGVIDHAGEYNNWLTWRLNEMHSFAVNMLSIDLFALRQLLEQHAQELPNNNLCIFHEHVVEMVHPLRQQLVVRPVTESSVAQEEENQIDFSQDDLLQQWEYQQQQQEQQQELEQQGSEDATTLKRIRFITPEASHSEQHDNAKHINKTEKTNYKIASRDDCNMSELHNKEVQPYKRNETSLTLSSMKWEAKYASEAVQYDLLICAEGANSRLRDVLDVEGFAADENFAVRWLLLKTNALSHEHIHRWLYKPQEFRHDKEHLRQRRSRRQYEETNKERNTETQEQNKENESTHQHHNNSHVNNKRIKYESETLESYAPIYNVNNLDTDPERDSNNTETHVPIFSSIQSSLCMAFPRIDGTDMFSLMIYMPTSALRTLSDTEILITYLPDVLRIDNQCTLRSFTSRMLPSPTIFCENLYNSVGLPSAVVIGDAAHHCHPFWMQGLSIGLEDGLHLLTQVDSYSRHFYDAIKLFSAERGVNGDALRLLTERCLFYERQKHTNPFIRFRNAYRNTLQTYVPLWYNNKHGTNANARYSKSIESMLNGRGYTSYKFAEQQQFLHNSTWKLSRLYD